MLNELQNWWQSATPEMQAAFREGGLVLAALLGGYFVGSLVARALRARNFDAAFRLAGSSTSGSDTGRSFTPTVVAGLLVRLTAWAWAGSWLARQHDRAELATTLGLIINRAWALAALLVAALPLGSLLSRRVIDCLNAGSETLASRNGSAVSHRGVAGAVAAGVYGLVVLLALLMAADFFDWPLTRNAALTLWQFAQHLLTAGAALLIGYLGAGWARDLTMVDTTSPEKRAGQYTGLAIVAATTVLAVAVVLTSASLLFGLLALAILGLALWLVRGHLPDIAAGLQLRAHRVREVWLDGAPWQVSEVGLLKSEVSRGSESVRAENRLVLEARMRGTPAAASRH